jgi:Spy/CpxP family protein refolding chaperone
MKLHKLLALSAIISLLGSTTAMADYPIGANDVREGGMGFHGWMEKMVEDNARRHESYGDVILRHGDALQLTDDQIGKIYRMHRANQQRIKGIGQKVNDATTWAHEIFLDPAKDETAIRQAAKAHSAAFDELVESALKTRREINAILTPEQLAKLPALKTNSK